MGPHVLTSSSLAVHSDPEVSELGTLEAMPGVIRGPGDDPLLSDDELVARRRRWFDFYTAQRNVFAPRGDVQYTCPCCGHRTLDERAAYEICPECGWEDDGQDDHDSAVLRGGPNGKLSLDAARAAYGASGGGPEPHVPPAEPT
jgi:cysteine-rich CPCC protein